MNSSIEKAQDVVLTTKVVTEEHMPQIRFKGFSDAWGLCKLGEALSEKVSNGIMNKPGRNELNIKHINVVNLYSPSHIHLDELEYINATESDMKRCNVEVGDIFLTRSSLKVEGIAHANILLDEGSLVFDDHIMRVKLSEKFEPFFVKEALNHSPTKREFITKAKTGTMTTIGQEDISSSLLAYPTKAEQTAIGNFFHTLDSSIAMQKRKCECLRKLKAAYLQQMFPQNGESVPRLRFSGFTNPWEQRKFFDNIERIIDFRGRTPKKLGLDWSARGYLALSALNVKDGYIDFQTDAHYGDDELYLKWMSGSELRKGQVLFTTEAPMGNVAQVPDDSKYILSQRTIAFNVQTDKITENFLATLLRTPKTFDELSALSSGGTAKGVSQKSLGELKVLVPKSLMEQTAIGNFFRTLDEQITVQQTKLDKLKHLKQAYLQKMFV